MKYINHETPDEFFYRYSKKEELAKDKSVLLEVQRHGDPVSSLVGNPAKVFT